MRSEAAHSFCSCTVEKQGALFFFFINFEETDILIVKSILDYFGRMQFDRPLF